MGDAFEKLAGLVGASVEAAPGQGLPRTRAEALALGLPRYFTGKPCKRGHVADRHVPGYCVECDRQRATTPERKEFERGRKEYKRQHAARLYAKPEVRAHKLQCALKRNGDAVLFAINQAAAYATRGIAYDIVPQCPEPHRSQLQALIERIRQDPTVGKAVVGLLRTMRELRKTELAQQRATESTTAAESST